MNTPPLIAYCALHQRLPSVPGPEYQSTMRTFHERLHEESRNVSDRRRQELIDEEERVGMIAESLGAPGGARAAVVAALSDGRNRSLPSGLVRSAETEIIHWEHPGKTISGMLQTGMVMLHDIGFPGDPAGLYESSFVIHGSADLDVLEVLVRDTLGIYGASHGKHLKEFGNYSYALYNLVAEGGSPDLSGVDSRFHEATICFSKPSPDVIKYAPFRKHLLHVVNGVVEQFAGVNCALWQRKLGLGGGREFLFRIMLQDPALVEEIIGYLDEDAGEPVVHRALFDEGALVIRRVHYVRVNG